MKRLLYYNDRVWVIMSFCAVGIIVLVQLHNMMISNQNLNLSRQLREERALTQTYELQCVKDAETMLAQTALIEEQKRLIDVKQKLIDAFKKVEELRRHP